MVDPLTLPLRDIHLPAPIPWWPPATGWWVLFGGVTVAAAVSVMVWRWWRRGALRRAAGVRLREIEAAFATHQDQHRLARELSMLCRQVMGCVSDQPDSLSGTGTVWLQRLDDYSRAKFFTDGIGQVLAHAPFDPAVRFDGQRMLHGIAEWIRRLPPPQPKHPAHV